ncbi:TetR/AcrR family transcriptional regulator [Streptomyces sp. NPDC001315]|uniref:TetR/AcrR family transcriptional regulator n=1 Tax=Streptomyces sp. NPDC001315 TaxID=3364562 RepID=UPI0036B17AB3
MSAEKPPRPLRADARRNRERILRTAREAFAAEGIGVPLDEIARRAGVGAGTVHRHFPTKEALFEAVVGEHLEQLTRDARAALEAPEPGPAFFGFATRMAEEAGAKQDLAEAVARSARSMGAGTEELAARLREVFAELLSRAQAAGAVRADVDAVDVQAVVVAAVTAGRRYGEHGEHARARRLAALVLDCLRPAGEGHS